MRDKTEKGEEKASSKTLRCWNCGSPFTIRNQMRRIRFWKYKKCRNCGKEILRLGDPIAAGPDTEDIAGG